MIDARPLLTPRRLGAELELRLFQRPTRNARRLALPAL
jgi:hypothetical protein